MKHLAPLVAAPLTLVAACAAAQETPAPPPPPPCTTDAAPYRDFDFWVGEWEVFTPDGQKAGDNRVSMRQNGCLILEEWTGAGGGVGMSQNFYDPAREAWRQTWTGVGIIVDIAGGRDGDAMAMEGEITYLASSAVFPFRGRWTPEDEGVVRQEFWQYDPEAETWNDWFVGLYRPAAPAEPE